MLAIGRRKKADEVKKPIPIIKYELTKAIGKTCRWIYTNDDKYLVYYKYQHDFENYFKQFKVQLMLINEYKESFIDSLQ